MLGAKTRNNVKQNAFGGNVDVFLPRTDQTILAKGDQSVKALRFARARRNSESVKKILCAHSAKININADNVLAFPKRNGFSLKAEEQRTGRKGKEGLPWSIIF